jgi:hypothetical protein
MTAPIRRLEWRLAPPEPVPPGNVPMADKYHAWIVEIGADGSETSRLATRDEILAAEGAN